MPYPSAIAAASPSTTPSPAAVVSVASLNAASRKTEVSKPSRRTAKHAIPTSAHIDPVSSAPAARASSWPRRSRAWLVIQTIMYVTIATATSATIDSSPSCARCGSRSSTTRSTTATPTQRTTASPTPAHIARSPSVRPVRRRKAAMMPTISEASSPSRSAMTKVVSTT